MTPAETDIEHASCESKLADARKRQDVSENFPECVDEIINRAFDELDLLSAALISKSETLAGLKSDQSGPLGPAESFPSVSSGASAPAQITEASFEESTASIDAGPVEHFPLGYQSVDHRRSLRRDDHRTAGHWSRGRQHPSLGCSPQLLLSRAPQR